MDKFENSELEKGFEIIKVNPESNSNTPIQNREFESSKLEFSKILANILSNSDNKQIKFNVNVSQNYFNSNINYIISPSTQENEQSKLYEKKSPKQNLLSIYLLTIR